MSTLNIILILVLILLTVFVTSEIKNIYNISNQVKKISIELESCNIKLKRLSDDKQRESIITDMDDVEFDRMLESESFYRD